MKNRKKILAASWHPGGANAIVPAIKKLQDDGKVEVVVIGHEFSEAIFTSAGILIKTIKDFGLPDVSAKAIENIIEAESPDLILTGTASQEGRAGDILEHSLIRAARKMGVKTLAVLDTWAQYAQRFSDERTGKGLDLLPDAIAIMDRFAKQEMLSLGFPAEKLVVTGNPHFDSLPLRAEAFTQEERQKVRDHIGFSHGLVFFFAGNIFSKEKNQFGYWDLDALSLIIDTLPKLQGVCLAIRLHPRETSEDRKQIEEAISRSGLSSRIRLVEDVDSQTLSLAADLTITGFSTMGIEAVYMKRPCISIQPNMRGEDQLVLSRRGIIPVGYEPDACRRLLLSAGNSAYLERLLAQSLVFSIDQKATERVAILIYDMVGRRGRN